jgi:hypothetical protein
VNKTTGDKGNFVGKCNETLNIKHIGTVQKSAHNYLPTSNLTQRHVSASTTLRKSRATQKIRSRDKSFPHK